MNVDWSKGHTKAQREVIELAKEILPRMAKELAELVAKAKKAEAKLPATGEHGLPVFHGHNCRMYRLQDFGNNAYWQLANLARSAEEWEVSKPETNPQQTPAILGEGG